MMTNLPALYYKLNIIIIMYLDYLLMIKISKLHARSWLPVNDSSDGRLHVYMYSHLVYMSSGLQYLGISTLT